MDYKELIAGNISGITGLEKEKVFELIEIPPRLDMGDFAFPCFTLAKTLHKAPPLIAQELAGNSAVTAVSVTIPILMVAVAFHIPEGVE